ncbi:MAG: PQQ-like beta-propeller repeat protein [Verrucomicrobia bacterium]|nr:PQQ-like beta-propeller repeat protein [Verrucomicrobiota bacterium]
MRIVACLLIALSSAAAGDWPHYRGPTHDGVSTDRILTNWSGSVTNPVWLVPVTNSFSSFAIRGGLAYSQVNRFLNGTNREVCVALSITNGTELWSRDLDDAYYPIDTGVGSNDGPRTTPSVDGDSIFVLTSYLKLYRLNATTGDIIWQKDLLTLYGGVIEDNQNSASPLVEDGLIFVNTCAGTTVLGGVGISNLMAFSTSDGALAWRSRNENMTLSTPTLATIHGVRQVIFATRTGVVSLNPTTGAFLWKFNYPFTISSGAELIVSPVVYNNIVFIMGPRVYFMGSLAHRITFTNGTWSTTQIWAKTGGTPANDTVATWWTTPVVLDGFLYGQIGNTPSGTADGENSDNCPLKCVDIQTGTIKWSTNNFGRGGVLLVNKQLVVLTEKGALVLVRPNTNAYTELGRFQAIPGYSQTTNKCWNTPAVADGKIYIRSTYFGALYDLSVPGLKLDPPTPEPTGGFQLTVRTSDGSSVNSNRLTAMEVRASTNLTLSPEAWPKLTNTLMLTNGIVVVTNVDGISPRRYFIVAEPK